MLWCWYDKHTIIGEWREEGVHWSAMNHTCVIVTIQQNLRIKQNTGKTYWVAFTMSQLLESSIRGRASLALASSLFSCAQTSCRPNPGGWGLWLWFLHWRVRVIWQGSVRELMSHSITSWSTWYYQQYLLIKRLFFQS